MRPIPFTMIKLTSTKLLSWWLIFASAIFFVYGIFVWSASAATYYVATNGTDSNPGTLSLPFRTIQKGVNVAAAGDTIQVRSGTYSPIMISKSGAINQPIVLQAS